ncbi:MAG: carbamoyltransferase HypF [Verrucomicrobiae bacterium]|nr:carbamoyltransferase HypF [Verrucomicrobiae bacterium]
MTTRVAARVTGRVQGVGFRPTVYRYATQFGLTGFVRNDPQGVTIEVEGPPERVGQFFAELTLAPPQRAVINAIERRELPPRGYRRFEVVRSEEGEELQFSIPPDLAVCDDCLRELRDPADWRFEYPFINCTNCGPRFTIIRDLPYDRARTSMAEFTMCPVCAHEYHEPRSRRFDAQPNACPRCGPQLRLVIDGAANAADRPVAAVQELLRRGQIVALKGLGGYHLACDAFSAETVSRLRERKRRPGKPFAVMFRDLDAVRRHCELSEAEEAELVSVERPIVLVRRRWDSRLARNIAPDVDTVGAFLPYTPLHHLLMEPFEALVMTSANLTEEPIVSSEEEWDRLAGIPDAILTHNRRIVHKCDDSVVRVVNGRRQFLRRARGYVPNPIRIADHSSAVLATGGELKTTFCLVRDGLAYVSQHIGDLKDYRTLEYYRDEIAEWQRLLRLKPNVVAYDLHPDYLSTRYALSLTDVVAVGVQHHHAHVVSVMAEHGLHDPVIGVSLDGTGYGPDGTVWGGEFLVCNRAEYERVAHFRQYALPGGDKAIAEPWRMAISVLHAEGLPVRHPQAGPVIQMIERRLNSPLTSSAGRLFDAVGAILGLGQVVSYEAQVAIRLESAANPAVTGTFPFELQTDRRPWVLNFGPAIRALVEQRRQGELTSVLAARFHNTVAAAIAAVVQRIGQEKGLRTVALSGGVFQNELLLRRTTAALEADGFAVYRNVLVPPNDGGLALGQAAVAVARGHAELHADKRGTLCA